MAKIVRKKNHRAAIGKSFATITLGEFPTRVKLRKAFAVAGCVVCLDEDGTYYVKSFGCYDGYDERRSVKIVVCCDDYGERYAAVRADDD